MTTSRSDCGCQSVAPGGVARPSRGRTDVARPALDLTIEGESSNRPGILLRVRPSGLRSAAGAIERRRGNDIAALEPEQEQLLTELVEASRRVPRESRGYFVVLALQGGAFVRHQGLRDWSPRCREGDVDMLGRYGLLSLKHDPGRNRLLDVTPEGFEHYDAMKRRAGEPAADVVSEVRQYLDGPAFHSRHPGAHARWAKAEGMLWAGDSETSLTQLGHLCREAMQALVADLVATSRAMAVDPDASHTIARIRSVSQARHIRPDSAVGSWVDALVSYWGTVSDLAQRQEHGATKEREPLFWEDGRRLVFQTAMVMYELDRALGR